MSMKIALFNDTPCLLKMHVVRNAGNSPLTLAQIGLISLMYGVAENEQLISI